MKMILLLLFVYVKIITLCKKEMKINVFHAILNAILVMTEDLKIAKHVNLLITDRMSR